MAETTAPTILHADLDAFYASVEQLLEPSLRGRPVAVGGSVVLAASYEARAFGVVAAMPGWRARQLCPELQFVTGHFQDYQRLGDRVIEIFHRFTPLVERISIDEAFLDVTGSLHIFGPPAAIASRLRQLVREETGLAVSVGAARTKHLAKIASQVAKPDGMVVVPPGEEEAFLERLPVGLIWGVGPVTRRHLAQAGIETIGELADTSPDVLARLLGARAGSKLAALAADVDPRPVATTRRASSIGAQAALGRRAASTEVLRSTLAYLADRVASRLRASGRAGRTVTVRVRFSDLRSVTRSRTLARGLSSTLSLTELAIDLAGVALADHPGEHELTLLAVSVSHLVVPSTQLELPLGGSGSSSQTRSGSGSGSRRDAVDESVDAIRYRFGRGAIGYATTVLSGTDRVPEAFRELAEHHP